MFTISRRDTVPARRPLHFTVCVLSLFSPVWLCATLWTVAHQAPLSLGFSRQEYWSGLPCPSPECDTQRESYHQVSEGRGKDLIDGGWRLHVGWIGSISFEPKHLIKLGQKVIKSLQGSRSKWGPFGPPANLKGVPDARQLKSFQLGSVQFSRSVMSNSLRPHECQASLSFTNSQSLLKPMPIESVMPSDHLIPCRPLLLPPALFPSIRVFSNVGSSHQMAKVKYWSFSFSISPSSEYSGLSSFRMDWLDLLAVQGTLRSLLQQHSSKASILQHSAFFTVQLSHPYMTNGKTIALMRRTFVGKVMSLLFNM